KTELGSGRGMLGFRWQQSTDSSTGITSRTEYRQDWSYTGLPSVTKTSQSSGAVLKQATYAYGCNNPATGTACLLTPGRRHFPSASQSVETGADLTGAALPTVTTSSSYDAFGNTTSVTVSTGDGYSKTTTNTYTNDTVNWFLGRLIRSQVTSTTP